MRHARRDSPDRTPCGPGGSSWRSAAGLPPGTPVRFYGVYDGHSGCLAAQFLKATLHVNFRGDPMCARVAPGLAPNSIEMRHVCRAGDSL